MKPLLHVSRVYMTGILVSLLIFLSCKKDAIPIDPSQSNAAMSKAGVANLALPILGEHQTRTATRFNDYPNRMWIDNFGRFNAANLAADDNAYVYSGKLSSRKSAMVVLQGFGFTIPTEARIDNIYIRVIRFKKGSAVLKDHYIRLNKWLNDVPGALSHYGSANMTNPDNYSTEETETIYSQTGSGIIGSDPLYTYLWTPTMVNDPDFGVIISTLVASTGSAVVYYEMVELTVEFTIL